VSHARQATCPECEEELGPDDAVVPAAGGGWGHENCLTFLGGRIEFDSRGRVKAMGWAAADVADADGRPVEAVWEIESRSWASVRTRPAPGSR
jgi:hypothetical protein